MKVKDMSYIALFAGLIAIGAFIQLPISIVPITMQTLFVVLAAMILKRKKAISAVLLYIVIGLIGLPVFAKGGGIAYIFQPTFGYLIGFIGAAAIVGEVAERTDKISYLLVSGFIAMIVIYGIGMLYFWLIQTTIYQISYGFDWIIYYLFIVYIPGDVLACIVAVLVGKRLDPIVN